MAAPILLDPLYLLTVRVTIYDVPCVERSLYAVLVMSLRLHCIPKMLALGIILVLHSHMPPALEIRSAAPAVCPPRPTTTATATADLSSPLTARASRDRRKSRERGGVATRWHATCKRVLQVGSLRSGRDGKTLTVGTDVHHES